MRRGPGELGIRAPVRHTLPLCAVRLGLLSAWAVVGVAGCARPEAPTPENGYRAFAQALRVGDARTAWAALSPATQQLAQARSKALSEASGGVVKDEPALMLLQSGTRPRTEPDGGLGRVTLLSTDGGAAVLEVTSGPTTQHITMVRVGTRWAVDLREFLQDTP